MRQKIITILFNLTCPASNITKSLLPNPCTQVGKIKMTFFPDLARSNDANFAGTQERIIIENFTPLLPPVTPIPRYFLPKR